MLNYRKLRKFQYWAKTIFLLKNAFMKLFLQCKEAVQMKTIMWRVTWHIVCNHFYLSDNIWDCSIYYCIRISWKALSKIEIMLNSLAWSCGENPESLGGLSNTRGGKTWKVSRLLLEQVSYPLTCWSDQLSYKQLAISMDLLLSCRQSSQFLISWNFSAFNNFLIMLRLFVWLSLAWNSAFY